MHVKDLAVKTDRDSQVAVGRGLLDFPGLFRVLLEISYRDRSASSTRSTKTTRCPA